MKRLLFGAVFCLTVASGYGIYLTVSKASYREDCVEIGELLNRPTNIVAGQCWLDLQYGITLPLPDAIEMLKFHFTAREMQPDDEQRYHEVERVRGQIILEGTKKRRP